ncbi:MAG: hypothetical protein QOI51_508 [Nocardioidaceae bacterium]|nr:hypothetical protein [Nocardioidaceae bacterium]
MHRPPDEPAAYYTTGGAGSYRSTAHAQGAWAANQQHMGPVSGLVIHELEAFQPRDDLMLSRVSFDILGVIPRGDVTVSTSLTRAGRTVELLCADLVAGGRSVVRAHGWRLLRSATSRLAGTEAPGMPGPDQGEPWDGTGTWSGGFIASLDLRVLPGRRPGRGGAWIRPKVALVDGVAIADLPRFFAMIDTMNGVAIRASPKTVQFPNTDLTVHLFRQPAGEWLGVDVEVSFGSSGVGLTSAVLNDASGPFGRALQILTIRPAPR